jgi:hypothetical protein
MNHPNTKAGTIGGTMLAILMNIKGEDILRTMVMAAVGAAVSFSVSLGLRKLMNLLKK